MSRHIGAMLFKNTIHSGDAMRLHEFILKNMEVILKEWDDFARKIQPDHRKMNPKELRDHAEEMLNTIAADMATYQSEHEREAKAEGGKPKCDQETAAEDHAAGRLQSGFPIDLLVSEYRALRASVLHLWLQEGSVDNEQKIDDILRFNEAIDQSLAESVARYSEAVITAQDVFLGTLGHDFRSPLNVVGLCAQLIMQTEKDNTKLLNLASLMINSVSRMNQMLDNLLEFTQSRLGNGVAINLVECDLAIISAQVVREFQTSHPQRRISNTITGDCKGFWDAGKIGRVYQNLISNALQYGFPDSGIYVSTRCSGTEAVFSVANQGTPIPAEEHERIFEVLQRAVRSSESGAHANMGLGLYIARDIVSAHKGTISVASTEAEGTTFTVRLPIKLDQNNV